MIIFKRYFSFFLIIGFILGGFILFPFSNAQGVGVKFTSCTVGGILATEFQNKIEDGLKDLGKKIGLGFLFGDASILNDKVPVIDEKFISTWTRKESRADIIARCGAREIFNAMSSGIVNNARTSGRNGGPAFVRNWRNFQTDAQYRGEGIFRAILSNTKLCNYIDKDIKNLFNVTKKISLPGQNTRTGNFDSYNLRANCTMPSNFSLEKYQKDFAGNGGWAAFSRMLEPQNNYYGTLFSSLDEAAKQRTLEESTDLNQVVANKGLTGKSGKDANDSCRSKDANGKCLAYKDIKTPGSIISDSVAATFQQEMAWITNVDELSEVISAATEVLLKRLLDFSDPNEGDYTIYVPPTISESPETEETTIPPGKEPASLLSDLQAERGNYGTSMSGSEVGKLLNAVAWKNKDTGWVLLGKASGTNCPMSNGTLISCDFLVHRPTLSGYDVLIDSDNTATPTWSGPDPSLASLIANGSRTLVPPVQP